MIKKYSLFFLILCISLLNTASNDSSQETKARIKYLKSHNLKQLEEILESSKQSIAILTESLKQEESWQEKNTNSEYQSPYEDEYNDYIAKMKQDLNRLTDEAAIISSRIKEINDKSNKETQSNNPIVPQNALLFDPYSGTSIENSHQQARVSTPTEESEIIFNRGNTIISQDSSSSTSSSSKTTPHKTPSTSSHILTTSGTNLEELQKPIKGPFSFPNNKN